ncbi:hypothetical protein [Embleya scabrispora]|uniref:hypothetical protein n=1 Tax=Embleya scabrispora TaxID=159449 RepID=UPI00036A87EF|nr:hypothetical protein [Embleya scabrispora]MYS80722.1 hypothetical protein [Streptomyces sp. SID5474]
MHSKSPYEAAHDATSGAEVVHDDYEIDTRAWTRPTDEEVIAALDECSAPVSTSVVAYKVQAMRKRSSPEAYAHVTSVNLKRRLDDLATRGRIVSATGEQLRRMGVRPPPDCAPVFWHLPWKSALRRFGDSLMLAKDGLRQLEVRALCALRERHRDEFEAILDALLDETLPVTPRE